MFRFNLQIQSQCKLLYYALTHLSLEWPAHTVSHAEIAQQVELSEHMKVLCVLTKLKQKLTSICIFTSEMQDHQLLAPDQFTGTLPLDPTGDLLSLGPLCLESKIIPQIKLWMVQYSIQFDSKWKKHHSHSTSIIIAKFCHRHGYGPSRPFSSGKYKTDSVNKTGMLWIKNTEAAINNTWQVLTCWCVSTSLSSSWFQSPCDVSILPASAVYFPRNAFSNVSVYWLSVIFVTQQLFTLSQDTHLSMIVGRQSEGSIIWEVR